MGSAIQNQNPPGKFLEYSSPTGYLYEVGYKRAFRKVGQLFREGRPKTGKKMKRKSTTQDSVFREGLPEIRKKMKTKSTTQDSVFREGLPEIREKIKTKSTTQNLISTDYSVSSFKKPITSSGNNVKPVEDLSLKIPFGIPTKLNNIRVSKLKSSVPQDSTSELVKTISVTTKQRKHVNNLNAILNKVSKLK